MSSSLLLLLALFALFLVLSGFFAASETALVSLGRIELQRLRERAPQGAARVEALKRTPARLLSAALIGQNLFNSAASAVATVAAENLLGERVGIAVAVVCSTLLLFSFGEMAPKSVAAAEPSRVALLVARPFEIFSRAVQPLAAVVNFAVSRLLRLLGLPQTRPAMTEEEMKAVINIGHAEGVIHGEERELLVRVLEFGNRHVSDVMVPRPQIVAVSETAGFEDVRAVFSRHKLSRIPVYRETLDNIVGILKAKDLFDLRDADEASFTPARHMTPPFLVPEFKRLEDLFREMRRRREHMAIAVDEYGGTAGLVTIADAIEALLGSIEDEYDEERPGFLRVDDRTFILDGTFRLDELDRRFGIAYPKAEVETVAGLLLLRFGRIPKKGERIRGRQAEYVVLEASRTAIRKIRMTVLAPASARRTGSG
jgi:putative hemolysin